MINHTLTTSRLISDRQIEALSNQIAERFSPEKIILFGSYAYAIPHDSSDVDLLIVMEFTGRKLEKMNGNLETSATDICYGFDYQIA